MNIFFDFVTVWYVLRYFTQALKDGSEEDSALEIKRFDLKWVVGPAEPPELCNFKIAETVDSR